MAILNPEDVKLTIDLASPAGNMFSLLGKARDLAKQLSMPPAEITKMLDNMQSKDYEHMIQVFDAHFGEYVDLIRVRSLVNSDE
jgi:hypothetical protein